MRRMESEVSVPGYRALTGTLPTVAFTATCGVRVDVSSKRQALRSSYLGFACSLPQWFTSDAFTSCDKPEGFRMQRPAGVQGSQSSPTGDCLISLRHISAELSGEAQASVSHTATSGPAGVHPACCGPPTLVHSNSLFFLRGRGECRCSSAVSPLAPTSFVRSYDAFVIEGLVALGFGFIVPFVETGPRAGWPAAIAENCTYTGKVSLALPFPDWLLSN